MFNEGNEYESPSLKNNIAFLESRIEDDLYNNIQFQGEVMDSEAFNKTMGTLESGLNRIYEKFRTLEDVLAYAREFTSSRILSASRRCEDLLGSIQAYADLPRGSTYIAYEVSKTEGRNASFTDRDGLELPHCAVMKGSLTLSSSPVAEVPLASVTRESEQIPYRTNLEDLAQGNAYRVFYSLDAPVQNGLVEKITVLFQEPSVLNAVDVAPTKCEVSGIYYLHENGAEEFEDGYATGLTRHRKAIGLKLVLTSTLYKEYSYTIDASRLSDNFWTTVRDLEYAAATGQETVADLDKLSGMAQRKAEYEEYLTKLEAWKYQRQQAMENQARYQQDYAEYQKLKAAYDKEYEKYLSDLDAWRAKYGK